MSDNNYRPIKRNKFITEDEISSYIDQGRQYIEEFMCDTIYYYKVNTELSTEDELYGEIPPSGLILENPIMLQGVLEFGEAEQKSYKSDNTLQYIEKGNLMASFYDVHLEEMGVLFCLGDFIAYRFSETQTVFYQITEDGRDNTSGKYMTGGRRPFYTSIMATPVDNDLINII